MIILYCRLKHSWHITCTFANFILLSLVVYTVGVAYPRRWRCGGGRTPPASSRQGSSWGWGAGCTPPSPAGAQPTDLNRFFFLTLILPKYGFLPISSRSHIFRPIKIICVYTYIGKKKNNLFCFAFQIFVCYVTKLQWYHRFINFLNSAICICKPFNCQHI